MTLEEAATSRREMTAELTALMEPFAPEGHKDEFLEVAVPFARVAWGRGTAFMALSPQKEEAEREWWGRTIRAFSLTFPPAVVPFASSLVAAMVAVEKTVAGRP